MFGFNPETELYWVNEVRIWTMGLAAVAAVGAVVAGYAQLRLQTVVADQKAARAAEIQRTSDERIANAQTEAARANERTAELEKQTVEAKRDLEKERSERIRLENRFGPRRLTDEQKAITATIIQSQKPKI